MSVNVKANDAQRPAEGLFGLFVWQTDFVLQKQQGDLLGWIEFIVRFIEVERQVHIM